MLLTWHSGSQNLMLTKKLRSQVLEGIWFPESDAYKEIEKPSARRQCMASQYHSIGLSQWLAVKNLPTKQEM